jgi:phosphoglycolate phosphatase
VSLPALIVFDLDGTLVDSLRDLAESANELLAACGCAPHSEAAIGRMVGEGAATLVARAFAAAGAVPPPDALERFLAIYDARPLRHTRPYAGVPELLTKLADASTLAVLTNKPLAATRAILAGLELLPFFGARVLGGDGPLPRKPDPSGLLSLIGARTRPADTVMVGDSPVDLRTAQAAGARSCVARYGFGAAAFTNDELGRSDYVISKPLELLSALL